MFLQGSLALAVLGGKIKEIKGAITYTEDMGTF